MTERRRLLVVTSTYPRWINDTQPGFVHELSRRLVDGFDVTVIAPHTPGARRREVLDDVEIIRFRYAPDRLERLAYDGGILVNLRRRAWTWALVLPFFLSMYFACQREANRNDYSLIHAHWLFPQGLVAVLVRVFSRRRIRILSTSHGGDLFGLRGMIGGILKRHVLEQSDAITVVSGAMRSAALRLAPGLRDIHVLPMGIDLQERFVPHDGVQRRNNHLLFVGRLVEKKGLPVLLEAFARLLKDDYTVRLDIVGDGPEKPALEAQIQQLNLEDHVRLVGSLTQERLPDYLRRATFLVMPSIEARGGDQEGFGLVQVEAMGCGCPVISSDLPGIRDVITDGETGVLVPPNDVSTLHRAMRDLLRDRPRRERLANTAMAHARERFDWVKIAADYRRLLESLDDRERSSTSRKSAS